MRIEARAKLMNVITVQLLTEGYNGDYGEGVINLLTPANYVFLVNGGSDDHLQINKLINGDKRDADIIRICEPRWPDLTPEKAVHLELAELCNMLSLNTDLLTSPVIPGVTLCEEEENRRLNTFLVFFQKSLEPATSLRISIP